MSDDIAIADIVNVVCAHFEYPQIAIRSARRSASLVRARQIAMYLAMRLTEASTPQIGRDIGKRDHTTVLYSIRKIEWLRARDASLNEELTALELAARSVARMRAAGHLPALEAELSPVEIARCVCAGGEKAAMRLPAAKILAIADALLAADEAAPAADPQDEGELGDQDVPFVVTPPMTDQTSAEARRAIGELVKTTRKRIDRLEEARGLPPGLYGVVHDFVGVEAMRRRSPRLNNPRARVADVERLKPFEDRADVAHVLRSLRLWADAEETSGEKAARERFEQAVSNLARNVLTVMETAAHG